jgi:hypothetical protein
MSHDIRTKISPFIYYFIIAKIIFMPKTNYTEILIFTGGIPPHDIIVILHILINKK